MPMRHSLKSLLRYGCFRNSASVSIRNSLRQETLEEIWTSEDGKSAILPFFADIAGGFKEI